jgi:molybdopterin-guanine dinucleotide biosynthesis protein A
MLGVVLAGGISRRLGRDKVELALNGEPLWRRQLGVLRAAGAVETVMVRRPGQAAPPGLTCWRDVAVDAGPMGGVHAALAPQTFPFVAVLAVDMPGIDAAWFHWLRGFCRPGAGAMAQHAEACEPLAAIYPQEALPEINARLQLRDYSLQRLAQSLAAQGRMSLIPLPAEKLPGARSLNTPADLEFWSASGKQQTR